MEEMNKLLAKRWVLYLPGLAAPRAPGRTSCSQKPLLPGLRQLNCNQRVLGRQPNE